LKCKEELKIFFIYLIIHLIVMIL